MPTAAPRSCPGSPYCPHRAGACPVHTAKARQRREDQRRGTAQERGYDFGEHRAQPVRTARDGQP